MVLKTAGAAWGSGWAQLIEFGNGNGANVLPGEINCDPSLKAQTVGLYDPTFGPCNVAGGPWDALRGCVSVKPGISQGPMVAGITQLIATDSSAHWAGGQVVGSNAAISSRIVLRLFSQ
jgi:hypothetical protein